MKDEADKCDALVVGAGPAGLAAAERLASAGAKVLVADAMPSVGRKFLMAGKSGLNLTKDEPVGAFLARFAGGPASFADAVRGFGPADVVEWAEGLGQPVFTGTTGRVFPRAMKASPLLRAWLARLDRMGVRVATRMRWTGWVGNDWLVETPGGPRRVSPDVAILALGGASWRRLGSDGAWADIFRQHGIAVAPFRPS
ncbi:MAG: NAD(P)-binding protein, partial [Rhodobacteraceae bacterium]|nr:NAD(P)-binding protein [Paracoccaceae bacterium]